MSQHRTDTKLRERPASPPSEEETDREYRQRMQGRVRAAEVSPTEAQYRARGGRRQHDGKGSARESGHAREEAQKRTLSCRACGSLVDKDAARRVAIKRAKSARQTGELEQQLWRYQRGDGCGARMCSTSFRSAQYLSRLETRIGQIERGERTLMAWHTFDYLE